ncbi:hypothetical protein KSP39_PZI006782 [Platanthera zijinensis]|uniref:Uncharacterized protein n=1 Tax=Platanthera zijinensis TaxID=2320716 RepID=A0AAP0BNZ2_9ASPA
MGKMRASSPVSGTGAARLPQLVSLSGGCGLASCGSPAPYTEVGRLPEVRRPLRRMRASGPGSLAGRVDTGWRARLLGGLELARSLARRARAGLYRGPLFYLVGPTRRTLGCTHDIGTIEVSDDCHSSNVTNVSHICFKREGTTEDGRIQKENILEGSSIERNFVAEQQNCNEFFPLKRKLKLDDDHSPFKKERIGEYNSGFRRHKILIASSFVTIFVLHLVKLPVAAHGHSSSWDESRKSCVFCVVFSFVLIDSVTRTVFTNQFTVATFTDHSPPRLVNDRRS